MTIFDAEKIDELYTEYEENQDFEEIVKKVESIVRIKVLDEVKKEVENRIKMYQEENCDQFEIGQRVELEWLLEHTLENLRD